jgi:hypothetical protein
VTNSELALFRELFRGRTDAIGLDIGGVQHREVTVGDYEGHLAGHRPIGIFPMLPGDVVWFGAIDLDEPDFELAAKLRDFLPAPAFIEQSRSGNAHVWVFFDKPTPAWAVRGYLKAATEAVGRRDVEVFPKQDALKPGMVGNYINLPWFGDSRPILESFGQHFVAAPRAGWLKVAMDNRHDPDTWEKRARMLGVSAPADREHAAAFGTQKRLHQCAEYIMENRERNPLRAGHRHQVIFHVAKMFLNWEQADPDEVLDWLRKLNEAGERPLPDIEVQRAFENAQRGQFTSTGCDDPLMAPYVDPKCPIAHG